MIAYDGEVEAGEAGEEHRDLQQLDGSTSASGPGEVTTGCPSAGPGRDRPWRRSPPRRRDEEREDRQREQEHLHRLGDDQHQHQVDHLQTGDLGLVRQVDFVRRDRARRRPPAGCPPSRRAASSICTWSSNGSSSSGEPRHQETGGDRGEDSTAPHSTPPCERRRDLPDLGVDEQEGDEQHQQRQRPGHQRKQQPEAAQRAAERPARDQPGMQRGQRVRDERQRRPR